MAKPAFDPESHAEWRETVQTEVEHAITSLTELMREKGIRKLKAGKPYDLEIELIDDK